MSYSSTNWFQGPFDDPLQYVSVSFLGHGTDAAPSFLCCALICAEEPSGIALVEQERGNLARPFPRRCYRGREAHEDHKSKAANPGWRTFKDQR
jgi:hypothetical protein